jgi:hypothetical protein
MAFHTALLCKIYLWPSIQEIYLLHQASLHVFIVGSMGCWADIVQIAGAADCPSWQRLNFPMEAGAKM